MYSSKIIKSAIISDFISEKAKIKRQKYRYFIMEVKGLYIQNIVRTVKKKWKLYLNKIAKAALNVEYKPQRFGALIMRIREPQLIPLIFSSGKIVVAGSKSAYDARIASRKFLKILNKLGYKVYLNEFKIQNFVCYYNMQSLISLEKFHL